LAIAVAVAITHHRRHLFRIAVSHCCHRRPPRQPLPPPSLLALQSPSPLAITVAIAVAITHCQELLPWHGKNSIQTI
jgi:hypothetical protein